MNKPFQCETHRKLFLTLRQIRSGLTVLLVYTSYILAQSAKPFSLNLAKLSPSFDQLTGTLKSVKVSFEQQEDYALISAFTDQYIRVTPLGKETIIHPEVGDKAYLISSFEAEVLNEVCNSMIKTLEKFNGFLKKESWDKCMYLDVFFPKFLKGFWYLYNAAICSTALKKSSLVPDSLFDISFNSEKSAQRIRTWRQTPQHITKLRIATEELIYQTRKWQKKELTARKKEFYSTEKFEHSFELFVRIYFNRNPTPTKTFPSKK